MTPQCSDMIIACRWHGIEINCSDLIRESYSSRGLCCAFNNKHKKSKYDTRFTKTGGFEKGLSMVLDIQLDDYVYTSIPSEGITVS